MFKKRFFTRLLSVLLAMSIVFSLGITASAANSDDEEEIAISEGEYFIKSISSGRYLDVVNGSTKNNAKIQIWDRDKDRSQAFTFSKVGDYWKITVSASGKALSVKKASLNSCALIVQLKYTGDDSQLWKIEESNIGYYSFINKKSGMAMDVYNGDTDNGTKLIQYKYRDGKKNQTFDLESTSGNSGNGGGSNNSGFQTEKTSYRVYNNTSYYFEAGVIPKPNISYVVKEEKLEANTVLDMICNQALSVYSEEWKNFIKLAREGKNDGSVNALKKNTLLTFYLQYDSDTVYIYAYETYAYEIWRK